MGFDLRDLVGFDNMLTPEIIKVVYCSGIAGAVRPGQGIIGGGMYTKSIWGMASGLLWMVLGPVLVRVYCELLIAAFNISGVLRDIRDRSPGGLPPRQ